MFTKRVFTALWLLVLPASSIFGQVASARLEGTVHDQSGAVVPSARVSVVNINTQGRSEIASDASGNFIFPSLQAGTYRLTVEAQGFRKSIIDNIELNVATVLSKIVKMEVGQTTETVEVQANTVTVQTTDSQVARAINMRDIDTLPQLGRSPIGLAAFQPGVQVNPGDTTFSHVNGNRQGSNNSTLDGIDVNDSLVPRLGLSLTANNTDSIGEFRVVTTAGKAEYGRSAGAQVELITRSGGNQFHGGLFEYLRNTALNANDFFNNQSGGAVPKFIQNTYGGLIGGPVIKNKTFFFFNIQRQKTLQETVRNRTVLTASAKAGIFKWNTAAGTQTYDIVANDPRKLGIDPTVKTQSLDLLPAPNNNDLGDGLNLAGYRFNNSTPSQNQQWTAKGDHNITPNHHVFLRWSYQTNTSYDALNNVDSTFPGQPTGTQGGTRWGFSAGSDWNLTPTTVNEFRTGHQSSTVVFFRPRVAGPSIISNDYTDPIATGFSQGRNSPVNEYTDNLTKIKGNHTLKFGANIRHTLQTGYNDGGIYPNISFSRSANGNQPPASVGPAGLGSTDRTRFENLYNELLGRVDLITTTFNSDLTKFLPAGTTRQRDFTLFEQGYFFQDDWKVRRNLTFNVGVRYDIYNAPHEKNSLQGTLDQVGALNYVNKLSNLTVVKTNTYAPTDFNNFAPRFGFAWDAFGNGKTAIRGNYGINYDRNIGATVNQADGNTPGLVSTNVTLPNISGATDVRLRDTIALPSVPAAPVLQLPVTTRQQTVVVFNPNLRSGYVQQYGMSIQREVARNTVFEAGYVGQRGVKLFMNYNLNQSRIYEGFLGDFQQLQAFQANGTAVSSANTLVKIFGTPAAAISSIGSTTVSTGAVGTAASTVDVSFNSRYAAAGLSQFYLRNYPQFGTFVYGTNDGRSYYDAMQLSIRRQTGMLRMALNYTWSHSLDNITVEGNGFTSPIDSFNLGLNKARGDFDKPQSFNAAITFTPPIGKGKAFLGGIPHWADTLIGGWDIGALVVAQSGTVFTVTSQRATGPNTASAFANYSGSRDIGGLDKRGDGVYLLSAAEIANFNQNVSAGSIGNSGRNAFRGPVFTNLDMSLIKKFKIKETHAVTFRAEAYNLPNHAAFATPAVNLNTPATFGKFASTIGGTTRTMQMALRYDF